jgi:hypothetical protein
MVTIRVGQAVILCHRYIMAGQAWADRYIPHIIQAVRVLMVAAGGIVVPAVKMQGWVLIRISTGCHLTLTMPLTHVHLRVF